MTLADLVRYERKHNEANGEQNRDGHNENLSWNNGVEGETPRSGDRRQRAARPPRAAGDAVCLARHDHADGRRRIRPHAARQQQRLCAGQRDHLARLAGPRPRRWRRMSRHSPALRNARCLRLARHALPRRRSRRQVGLPDVDWLTESGQPLDEAEWQRARPPSPVMVLAAPAATAASPSWSMATAAPCVFTLPARDGFAWSAAGRGSASARRCSTIARPLLAGRTVVFTIERTAAGGAGGRSTTMAAVTIRLVARLRHLPDLSALLPGHAPATAAAISHGITARLPHVASLGVDAIWLSPFFKSPMADMGYDVSDYCAVDPMFGTLEDFDALVAEAHRLGLKVIIDQVLSHTSDQHRLVRRKPRQPRQPQGRLVRLGRRQAGRHARPTTGCRCSAARPGSGTATRQQYYMHNFLASQPDLNFHNPEVQDALLETVRFWLERGVDGFRLDTVNYYFHDRRLRNNPPLPRERRPALSPTPTPTSSRTICTTRRSRKTSASCSASARCSTSMTAAPPSARSATRHARCRRSPPTRPAATSCTCATPSTCSAPQFSAAHVRGCVEAFEARGGRRLGVLGLLQP